MHLIKWSRCVCRLNPEMLLLLSLTLQKMLLRGRICSELLLGCNHGPLVIEMLFQSLTWYKLANLCDSGKYLGRFFLLLFRLSSGLLLSTSSEWLLKGDLWWLSSRQHQGWDIILRALDCCLIDIAILHHFVCVHGQRSWNFSLLLAKYLNIRICWIYFLLLTQVIYKALDIDLIVLNDLI